MSYNVIIAGGGTGGHIFPAIAIANALKALDANINLLFVGASGKMEMEKIPQAGYQIEGIDIAGLNRSSLLKNITLPFKIIKSFFQVRKIFKKFQPQLAIGVGGYSTYPVLRLAQQKGIPTFVFETNSYPGKSNILLGKRATAIFTASDGMEKFFGKEKLVVTGNPVRKEIVQQQISKADAVKAFGLDAEKQVVLAFGGSLGARSINEAIANGLPLLEQHQLQLIWQTGKATAEKYKPLAEGKNNIWQGEFITDMYKAYAAADIIVSRAGGSIYELAIVGKPAVLVPYPFATEDHQTANAMNLVNKQAALLVKDSDAGDKLVTTVVELSTNETLKKQLAANIKKQAITNADEIIAATILKKMAALQHD